MFTKGSEGSKRRGRSHMRHLHFWSTDLFECWCLFSWELLANNLPGKQKLKFELGLAVLDLAAQACNPSFLEGYILARGGSKFAGYNGLESDFKATVGNFVKPCLKNKTQEGRGRRRRLRGCLLPDNGYKVVTELLWYFLSTFTLGSNVNSSFF